MAYEHFTNAKEPTESDYLEAEGGSRLIPSGNRDRLVDCMEEFEKYTLIMRSHFNLFNDRYSERTQREATRVKEEQASKTQEENEASEGNAKRTGSAGLVNGVDIKGL